MVCAALPGERSRVQDKEKKKTAWNNYCSLMRVRGFLVGGPHRPKIVKEKKKRGKANRTAVAAEKIYPRKAVVVLVHRQRKGSKRRARVPVESRKNVRRCLREEEIRPEFRGSVASLWIFIEKEAKRGRGSPVEMSESGRYLTLGSSDEWKALLRHR